MEISRHVLADIGARREFSVPRDPTSQNGRGQAVPASHDHQCSVPDYFLAGLWHREERIWEHASREQDKLWQFASLYALARAQALHKLCCVGTRPEWSV